MIKLNTSLNDVFSLYKQKVTDAISDEIYRYERYGVVFSLAAVYGESETALNGLVEYMRKTDKLIKITPNYSCICFDGTDISGAIKASQNIVKNFSAADSSKKIYIGVTGAENNESNYDIVSRAFYTLNEAKKHNISTVEDDNILDSVI